ncbi:MAG: S49 family peptidase [Magnetococcales bacterium]|nr:S49 family peptidase [Magnetococcales bacterium]
MDFLPHLAARVIGRPLIIQQAKMDAILSVVGERIGIEVSGAGAPDFESMQGDFSIQQLPGGIAVIPIHGTLAKRVGGIEAASGLVSYAQIENAVLDAVTDPAVRGVMLSVDSPGGEVGDGFDVAETIRNAGTIKPIWAVANDAYSGGYLLASTASRIFIPQAAGVGSVGVIAVHVDTSVADAKAGHTYTTIFAGARKADYSQHDPLTSDAHAVIQGEVDRLYSLFVRTVAANRRMSEEAVRATEAGVFFGQDAVSIGFADQVGTMRDAVSAMLNFLDENRMINQPVPKASKRMENEKVSSNTEDGSEATPDMAKLARDRAVEISQLCAIAGQDQRIAGYLADGKSVDEVRNELLALRASASTVEIIAHIERGTTDPGTSPLVQAARQYATKMGGAK